MRSLEGYADPDPEAVARVAAGADPARCRTGRPMAAVPLTTPASDKIVSINMVRAAAVTPCLIGRRHGR